MDHWCGMLVSPPNKTKPKWREIWLWWQCDITLRPRLNGLHFPNDIFKSTFLKENVWISINISLKLVPKDPINNSPALIQIMACRLVGTNDVQFSDAYMHNSASARYQWGMLPGDDWWVYYPVSCDVIKSLRLIWRSGTLDEMYRCPILKWVAVTKTTLIIPLMTSREAFNIWCHRNVSIPNTVHPKNNAQEFGVSCCGSLTVSLRNLTNTI